ncbi:MAG: CAP domain-containing protein [Mangrovicoccus sp.]
MIEFVQTPVALELGQRLNAFRLEHGIAPLEPSQALTIAAQLHAEDMAARIVLSHQGGNGSQVSDRLEAQGYDWWSLAENVAFGQENPAQAMESWRKSDGHRENMLLPGVTQYGIGLAYNHIGPYWVMDLAAPR